MIELNLPADLLALANDTAAVAALPDQIAQRDPACIPVLAALVAVSSEGLLARLFTTCAVVVLVAATRPVAVWGDDHAQ